MKLSDEGLVKRYKTDIKSAQGVLAMATVLSLIYIIEGVASGSFDFYFATAVTGFFLKAAEFSPEFNGSLSAGVSIAVVTVCALLFIAAVLLAKKNTKMLWFGLVLYAVDTVFLFGVDISGYFGAFKKEDVIDLIFHAFIMVFLIVGVLAVGRLEKRGVKPEPI